MINLKNSTILVSWKDSFISLRVKEIDIAELDSGVGRAE